MAPDPIQVMDNIFQQITTTSDPYSLLQYLRGIGSRDIREAALASPLSSGQDPLTLLNPTTNTVGLLYILVARLYGNNAQQPPIEYLVEFCKNFDPIQARCAPERVTLLAKGIQRLANALQSPRLAVTPLFYLLTRYPPDGSYLTTIHSTFVMSCLQAKTPAVALPVLTTPITNIDTNLSDLTYNDNLLYHYTGGMALAMLKRWTEAEEFFEIVVTAPASYPAAIQVEALKKLKLVQLIVRGEVSSLPRYAHPLLTRHFKGTAYQIFINSYPRNVDALREILQKEHRTFATDKNVGLLTQALERAPRWSLKKLTATYLSLNLADIAKEVKIESPEVVRSTLLSMIEDGDISATIAADGSVTFSDPPPQFNRAQVDKMVRDVQAQAAYLEALEKDLAKSKEYLSKAVKGKDTDGGDRGGWGGGPMDTEEMLIGGGDRNLWAEDNFS